MARPKTSPNAARVWSFTASMSTARPRTLLSEPITFASSPHGLRAENRDTSVGAQQKVRISDQLAGPVIGDVAAALDLERGDTVHGQQVVPVRATAQGDHVRVLDEHQRVRNLVTLPRRPQLALQRPDLAVLAHAQVQQSSLVSHRINLANARRATFRRWPAAVAAPAAPDRRWPPASRRVTAPPLPSTQPAKSG